MLINSQFVNVCAHIGGRFILHHVNKESGVDEGLHQWFFGVVRDAGADITVHGPF